ncbi:transcription termination factor MTERF2, chloroplastic-like [Magnolia sinica]|uniref:transcription termination factor MTERF2, chloroplastic-like n=1 Tax=Magnolia sinica TaxID=86752 RepID=UPI0026583B17|nr:transcription termination factor MTERF2, chloroplastic-like [Magnolia sinica]
MPLHLWENLISFSVKTPSNRFKTYPYCSLPIPLSRFFSSSQSQNSISVVDYLINQHGFSSETVSKASTALTRIKTPEKSDSVLAFFVHCGFSRTHVEKMIQHAPKLLSANVDKTLKPKIKIFEELGFPRNDIVDIVSTDPWILTRSAEKQLLPSLLLLRRVVQSNAAVCKVLKLSGWFLKCDLEKTMVPSIDFMKSCGISEAQISKLVFGFPRFFVLKPDTIKAVVKRVDEFGFNRQKKMYLHAIRIVSSMSREKLEYKFGIFRSLGWSEVDILSVFRRVPQVFSFSEKKIGEGMDFLLNTRKLEISFIVLNPGMLVYSLEGRIKPRHRVLEILERKDLLRKDLNMVSVLRMTDQRFLEKYVHRYPDEFENLFRAYKGLELKQ